MNRRFSQAHARFGRAIQRRAGFTLIEAALALMIVGVGVVASMRLFASCGQENRVATNMTSAMLLGQNIREAMNGLAFNDPYTDTTVFGPEAGETLSNYNDLDDFDAQTFNPPIDSLRRTITAMSQYTQVVTVAPIFPNKLDSNLDDANPEISDATYTGAVRVRVRILYRARPDDPAIEIYRTAWVRLDN
jgi:type II secretory pathway pseudopilin PulG